MSRARTLALSSLLWLAPTLMATEFVIVDECYDCLHTQEDGHSCEVRQIPGQKGNETCTIIVVQGPNAGSRCELSGRQCFVPYHNPQDPPDPDNNCQARLHLVEPVANGELAPGWHPPRPARLGGSVEG